MGGGASQPQSKAPDDSAGSKTKSKAEPLLEKSPFDDIGTGGNIIEDEIGADDSPQKAVASATKLKRMAFGQQTYMDQQRDYDQTLAKLDLNKSGVVDWVDPGSTEKGSPSKFNSTPKGTPSAKMKFPDSSFLSPADAKSSASTPDGAKRAASRKPPPPSTKPTPNTPVQAGTHPTQQVVQAPNHTPNRPPQQQQAHPANRMSPTVGTDTGPSSNSSTLVDGMHGHSFSQAPHKAMYTQPNHNHSENQLVNRTGNHAGLGPGGAGAYSGGLPNLGNTGPPAGLVSRPFPGHHQGPPTDASSTDLDDSMIADFSRSVKVDTFKKPDIIPILSINNAVANDASTRTKLPNIGAAPATAPAFAPAGQTQNKGNMQHPANAYPSNMTPLAVNVGGRPANNTANGANSTPGGAQRPPAMHPQGAMSPGGMGGMGPGGPGAPTTGMIQPVRPMTMGSSGAVPPSLAPSTGSGMRPAPAPVPHGAAMMTAPVVKETKNVKRNRAQIPTQLAHALPTTGDWMNKRYIVNNYILLEILGTGSYGEVRLCKDRTTDKLYAIKIFSKDFLKKKKTGKSDETFFEDIKREIAIMKKLLHPNVLRLFEVLDDPKVNKMYLVLEYMKMGDLINVLKSRGADAAAAAATAGAGAGATTSSTVDGNQEGTFTPLTDMEVWNIFRQVVSGIRYLHYQNVVHGDIKPQNLLLGEDGLVKIADFGISQMLSASGQKLADAAGTPAFMSPELCEGKSFSGQLADIWAIGATMFMLRFGNPPFLAKSIINLYHKICNDPLVFPGPIDPGLRNLLENLLEKDPTKRYTLQQIIMHPWFRHPPSVHAQLQPAIRANASNNATAGHSVAGAAAAHSSGTPTAAVKRDAKANTSEAQSSITFKPPDNYEAEEEAAMKVPVKIDHHDEVYMSIGGIQPRSKSKNAHPDEKIDEDGGGGKGGSGYNSDFDPAGSDRKAGSEADEVLTGGDMMETDWGADVFQMVDDGDNSDNDDSVDEDSGDDGNSSKKAKDDKKKEKNGSEGSMMATRNEMSQEEEEKRARRFMAKITKKSNEDMALDPRHAADSKDSSTNSVSTPAASMSKTKAPATLEAKSSSQLLVSNSDSFSSNAPTPKVTKLPFKATSVKQGARTRDSSVRMSTSRDGDDEETDELTMDDFNAMMDTLALQPKKFSDIIEEDVHAVSGGLLPIDGFSAELSNKKNGIAAAFNSEKGSRHTQEDRCVLLPNVAQMQGLESARCDGAKLELLSNFTIACIFDGHSGWRCAQYLSQHFAPTLVMHDKFLDKSCEAAMIDVCASIDAKVCDMLLDEEDASGSTGVIAVYDGRRHVLTVAGVGDSMCVLSRSGKAVILNRMHRLDNEDERERVKRAGGTVINNRVNGLLAISRAFGDTQFKPEKDDTSTRSPEGLVISTPEVYSELITPKTEFAIMATDGLWDVMTPQMAVTFVRNMLHKHRDLEEAARELSREALTRGSVDNVTVLVMSFHFSDEGKIKSGKY